MLHKTGSLLPLSISVLYIKEEVDCDELSAKNAPIINDIRVADDALNVEEEIKIKQELCQEEVFIKMEPPENDLVSDCEVTLLKCKFLNLFFTTFLKLHIFPALYNLKYDLFFILYIFVI